MCVCDKMCATSLSAANPGQNCQTMCGGIFGDLPNCTKNSGDLPQVNGNKNRKILNFQGQNKFENKYTLAC